MAKKTEPEIPETEQQPESVGRPSSYRPEYAAEAIAMCELGATDADLADYFGVSVRTIANWQTRYPDFHTALKTGKSEADDRVQRSLFQRAIGTEYEEAQPIKVKKITYDDKGKKLTEEEKIEIVMVKRVIPADTTAAIFWMKNRRSKEWRDVHKHEHGQAGAFDDLNDEQLAEYIIAEAKEMMPELEPPKPVKALGRRNATKH